MEKERFSDDSIKLLKKKGLEIIPYDSDGSLSAGGLQMLSIDENSQVTGVADPRRDGSAAGV